MSSTPSDTSVPVESGTRVWVLTETDPDARYWVLTEKGRQAIRGCGCTGRKHTCEQWRGLLVTRREE